MARIPSDLYPEILLCLPSKSVIRFRAVCKTWLTIIDDPCFDRAHTNKQQQLSSNTTIIIRSPTGPTFLPLFSVDLEALNSSTNGRHIFSATPLNNSSSELFRLEKLYSVAACNGLVLLSPKEPSQNWEIWNPLTHELLELPSRNFKRVIKAFGLGYDSAKDNYKAVVIDRESYHYEPETHVYSLKSDSWRKIMDYPVGELAYGRPGVFLSGALHWISSSLGDPHNKKIIALDLGAESYRELKMPPIHKLNEYDFDKMPWQCQELDVLSGSLVVSDAVKYVYFDLWVRVDYGADDSWTKVFRLSRTDTLYQSNYIGLRPVAFLKNKTQVFVHDRQTEDEFYLFDLESGSVMKRVRIHGLYGRFWAQVFQGTIFRLHDNCGGGVTGRRSKTSQSKIAGRQLVFCVRDLSSKCRCYWP